jgi:hypothetical protein
LVSYQEIPVDGSASFEPLGHEPKGIIMYTSNGYMTAQLTKPDRPDFSSGNWFAGTDEDYRAEASSYIAYTGPFPVDEDKQTLTHSMFISLFPNWTRPDPTQDGEAGGRHPAPGNRLTNPVRRQNRELSQGKQ